MLLNSFKGVIEIFDFLPDKSNNVYLHLSRDNLTRMQRYNAEPSAFNMAHVENTGAALWYRINKNFTVAESTVLNIR